MSTLIGQASETALGGHKLAKQLAGRLSKATEAPRRPDQTTKELKKAAKQLKQFETKLDNGLAKRKAQIDPALGASSATLVGEARAELAGLGAG